MSWVIDELLVGGLQVVTFALWFVPVLVTPHTQPIPTFYSEAVAIVLASAVLILALLFHWRRRTHVGIPCIGLAPLGFAFVIFVQLAMLRDANAMPLFFVIFFSGTAYLAMQAGHMLSFRPEVARIAFRNSGFGILLAGLLSTAFAWAQALSVEEYFFPLIASFSSSTERRLFANLYQPNHLATVLSLASASAVYLVASRRLSRVSMLFCIGWLSTGLVLTGSRTAWIQQAVVSLAAVAFARFGDSSARRSNDWRSTLLACAPLAFLAVATPLVGWLDSVLALNLGASALGRFGDQSQMTARLALWHYALVLFGSSPILGVGWGEYVWAQYLIAGELGPISIGNHAHNAILDIMAKTGLLGLFASLTPIVLWAWRNMRLVEKRFEAVNRIYCLLMFAVFAVHAMLEYPHTYAFFLLPISFLMGLIEGKSIGEISSGLAKSIASISAMAVFLVVIFAFHDYKKAEMAFGDERKFAHFGNSSLIYGDWTRYHIISLMSLDRDLVAEKIRMHEDAFRLGVSPLMIRRYIILLALDGRLDEALLQVPRLKSISLHTFPEQYRKLLEMCGKDSAELLSLKRELQKRYGEG